MLSASEHVDIWTDRQEHMTKLCFWPLTCHQWCPFWKLSSRESSFFYISLSVLVIASSSLSPVEGFSEETGSSVQPATTGVAFGRGAWDGSVDLLLWTLFFLREVGRQRCVLLDLDSRCVQRDQNLDQTSIIRIFLSASVVDVCDECCIPLLLLHFLQPAGLTAPEWQRWPKPDSANIEQFKRRCDYGHQLKKQVFSKLNERILCVLPQWADPSEYGQCISWKPSEMWS